MHIVGTVAGMGSKGPRRHRRQRRRQPMVADGGQVHSGRVTGRVRPGVSDVIGVDDAVEIVASGGDFLFERFGEATIRDWLRAYGEQVDYNWLIGAARLLSVINVAAAEDEGRFFADRDDGVVEFLISRFSDAHDELVLDSCYDLALALPAGLEVTIEYGVDETVEAAIDGDTIGQAFFNVVPAPIGRVDIEQHLQRRFEEGSVVLAPVTLDQVVAAVVDDGVDRFRIRWIINTLEAGDTRFVSNPGTGVIEVNVAAMTEHDNARFVSDGGCRFHPEVSQSGDRALIERCFTQPAVDEPWPRWVQLT